jgi:hypothetical protein
MSTHDVATNGARLEVAFEKLSQLRLGQTYEGFTVIDIGTYVRGNNESYPGESYPKAITIRDKNGNIYVHFNGTGDGNWGYNSAAYGGSPSPMQEWALSYFNGTIEKYYEGQSAGNLYVTGHSQGGNNAQFLILNLQSVHPAGHPV